MASRKKNLLEAFQSANAESKPAAPQPVAPVTPVAPSRAPAAPPASAEPAPQRAALAGGAGSRDADRDATAARRAALAAEYGIRSTPSLGTVLAVGLAFALGIAIGRGTAGKVEAAEGDADTAALDDFAPNTPSARPAQSPRREDGGAGGAGIVPSQNNTAPASTTNAGSEAGTSALFDVENEFTVVVVAYGETQTDLAWSTYDFLRDAGVPAFRPYLVRDKLVIFAGAAPTRGELASIERSVRGLTYNGNTGVFGDAYTIPISNFVRR